MLSRDRDPEEAYRYFEARRQQILAMASPIPVLSPRTIWLSKGQEERDQARRNRHGIEGDIRDAHEALHRVQAKQERIRIFAAEIELVTGENPLDDRNTDLDTDQPAEHGGEREPPVAHSPPEGGR